MSANITYMYSNLSFRCLRVFCSFILLWLTNNRSNFLFFDNCIYAGLCLRSQGHIGFYRKVNPLLTLLGILTKNKTKMFLIWLMKTFQNFLLSYTNMVLYVNQNQYLIKCSLSKQFMYLYWTMFLRSKGHIGFYNPVEHSWNFNQNKTQKCFLFVCYRNISH